MGADQLLLYPPAMVQQRRRSGFIEPCLPSKVARPPSGLTSQPNQAWINSFAAYLQFVIVARHVVSLTRLEAEEFHIDARRDREIYIKIGCSSLYFECASLLLRL
jgi:hypothetical protein